jgi:hypothetical protein
MNNHFYGRYLKFIDCLKRQAIVGYSEEHHIIPKSMGGDDSPSNLVLLNARQHYIAHWMLFKAFRNKEMSFAFISMCKGSTGKVNRSGVKYNSRAYQQAKESWSKALTGRKGSPATEAQKSALSARMVGKVRVIKEDGTEALVTKLEKESNPSWKSWNKGKTIAYKESGERFWVSLDDPRLKTGELIPSGAWIARNNSGTNNAMFKGWYITPKGRFATVAEAIEANGCGYDALDSRCIKMNDKLIHPNAIKRSSDLAGQDPSLFLGKTWKQVGWGFERYLKQQAS